MSSDRIHRYRIEKHLGFSGPSEVYKAWDDELKRWVAIKSIFPAGELSSRERKRARREARAAAAISHTAVAQVHDVFTEGDRDHMVMEFVEGESLGELLQQGPLKLAHALRLGLDVAEGLHAAHSRGVIHRDLKLDNIMVTPNGRAKILDFGLAKLTGDDSGSGSHSQSDLIGTIIAMSPEQIKDRGNVDHRSDLFSLGTLLYELTVGSHPFRVALPWDTITNIVERDPPAPHEVNPKVPRDVSAMIMRLLAKDRKDRPRGIEVIRTLEGHCPSTPSGTAEPIRRPRLWLGLAVVALIIVLGSGTWLALRQRRQPDPLFVAVLKPLVQGEGTEELIAEGVRMATINTLSSLEEVFPISSSEVDAFPGSSTDVARAVAAHEALTLLVIPLSQLSCSVTVTRINASTGRRLWATTFNAPTDSLQSLADAVAAHVRPGYGDRAIRHNAHFTVANAADYQAYLDVHNAVLDPTHTVPRVELLERLKRIRQSSPKLICVYTLEVSISIELFLMGQDPLAIVQAEEAVRKAQALAPDDPRTLLAETELALAIKDLDRAEAAISRLETTVPCDPTHIMFKARLTEQRGDLDRALELMRESVLRRPSAQQLSELSAMELRMGKVKEARLHLNRGLQAAPDNLRLLSQLAELELLSGSAEKAEQLFDDLAQRAFEPGIISNLAVAKMLQGNYEEAGVHLEHLVDDGRHLPSVLLRLSDCYRLQGMTDKADMVCRELLDYAEESDLVLAVDDLRAQAHCLAHLGQIEAAETAIAQAMQLDPRSPLVLYSAAIVSELIGREDDAAIMASKAISGGVNQSWFDLPWFAREIGTSSRLPASRP